MLHVALIVLAAAPAWGDAGASVLAGQSVDNPQGVCLLQHPKSEIGRKTARPAPPVELNDGSETATEDEANDEIEAESDAESVRPKKASHLSAHRHARGDHGKASHSRSMLEGAESHTEAKHSAARPAGTSQQHQQKKQQPHHRHQGSGHRTAPTRAVREDSEPVQFLEIRTHPDSNAPLVGMLQAGEHFLVHGSRKSSSGEVWLELSDGRGFVPRAHASRVDAAEKMPVGLIESTSRVHTPAGYLAKGAPPVSMDTMANNFPKKVAPKHDVDHDALDMKKAKMSIKALPKESSYQNHLTETADWGDEYPVDPAALGLGGSPANAMSGAVHAFPVFAVLAAGLAQVGF